MLNVKQLRVRLGGVDGELPVKIVINDDVECDVDFAFYSLAYNSFVLKITVDDDKGYYYDEDEYCFYIKHTESELSIPIQKETSYYVVSDEAIKTMIDYLNEKDSNIIFDLEDDLRKAIDKIKQD